MLYPTTGSGELVGAVQLRSTECATAVPVPLNATAAVLPLVELLLIVSCPVTAPATVGRNCTCSVAVCAGFSVSGKLPPTVVNSAPEIVAVLMVTGDLPADVRVRALVVAVLTASLPKLRLVALTVNCGFAATPVPLKATAAVLPLAELLLIVSCPVAAPTAVGRNCSCKVTDWFGLSVTGKLPATRLKPVPAIEAEFTVTAEVPDDVSVTEPVAEEFTVTLPKLRVEALNVRLRDSFRFADAPADVTNARQTSARRRTLPRPLSREIPVKGQERRPICTGD
jgi:hypothetical protein